MKYCRLSSEWDKDIPFLCSVYRLPEIARFISIDEKNYWHYVTASENVYFYKVYDGERFVATIHCELTDNVLFMDIVVFPEYQKQGIGTGILSDIQSGTLALAFERIEVSIDESNAASLGLFEKMKFLPVSKEDELIQYSYVK